MSALAGVRNPAPTPSASAHEQTRVLYEKYGQRVFTFCYGRLREREEAQDATQTTFIYVLRALERGVVPEFELAWLLKIAFNVCRSTRRSWQRQGVANRDGGDIEEIADRSDGTIGEGSERLEALREALRTLPENQRHGILLREWQGLSYAEIADELGVSVAAVETLLFRARRNLASRLEHVRGAFGVLTLPLGSVLPYLRAAFRGVVAKVAVIGAAGSVALVPIAAVELLEAPAAAPASGSLEPTLAAARTLPGRAAVRRSLVPPRSNSTPAAGSAPSRARGSLRRGGYRLTASHGLGSYRVSPMPAAAAGGSSVTAPPAVAASAANAPASTVPPAPIPVPHAAAAVSQAVPATLDSAVATVTNAATAALEPVDLP